jgi:TP901 family phage tail tape measure protein
MANKKVVGELVYKIRGDDNQYNKVINRSDKQARGLGKTVKNTSASMIKNLAGAYLSWQALKKGIDATIGSAIRYEDAFAGTRKTVDATEEQFEALSDRFRELSKEIPVTAEEFARIGELAGQLGVQVEEVDKFAEVIAKVGVTTNLSLDQASTEFARFANIMGMSLEEVDRLGSSIVNLGNNFATTESEISQMALRIAGAGKTLGLTEPQVLAWATALSSVGINAQMGGSAISRMMIDISGAVSKGGSELEKFAKVSGKTSEEFATQFKDNANEALLSFFDGLSDVDEQGGDTLAVLDNLGITEVRLRDAVLRLTSANDELHKSMGISEEGWDKNNALNIEAAKRFGTTASQIQLLKNNVNDLTLSIGNALIPVLNNSLMPALLDVFDRIAKTSSAMRSLNKEMGGLVAQENEYKKIQKEMRSLGVLTPEQSKALENAEKEIELNKQLVEEKKKLQKLNEIAGRSFFAGFNPKERAKDAEFLEEEYGLYSMTENVIANRKLANKAILEQAENLGKMEHSVNKYAGALEELKKISGNETITPDIDADPVKDLIGLLNDGTEAGKKAGDAVQGLADRWATLEDETVNLAETGTEAIEDLADEYEKNLKRIQDNIKLLKEEIGGLESDLKQEDIGIAEQIAKEEREIAKLKDQIAEEKGGDRDPEKLKELRDELNKRTAVLEENAELQKQLDDEINEARRRARMTDLERTIEDYKKERKEIEKNLAEKRRQLNEEVRLEEEQKGKVLRLKEEKQERINEIIALGNQRFQDLADNRVKMTQDEVEKQIKWYNKLAEAIAKTEKAEKTKDLPDKKQFHAGGYVRSGGEVHAGEYVIPANMVNQYSGLIKALEDVRGGNTSNSTTNNVTMNNNINEQIDMDAVLKNMSFELNK